jgi:hypothetical protein
VDETPIKITNADTVITARLADNATARGLAGEPPLTMTVKDFNHVDKLRDFLGGCLLRSLGRPGVLLRRRRLLGWHRRIGRSHTTMELIEQQDDNFQVTIESS